MVIYIKIENAKSFYILSYETKKKKQRKLEKLQMVVYPFLELFFD